jgi:hypothetical protein
MIGCACYPTPIGRKQNASFDVRESVELRAPKKAFFVSALLVVLLSFKSKAATFTVEYCATCQALHRHFSFPHLVFSVVFLKVTRCREDNQSQRDEGLYKKQSEGQREKKDPYFSLLYYLIVVNIRVHSVDGFFEHVFMCRLRATPLLRSTNGPRDS